MDQFQESEKSYIELKTLITKLLRNTFSKIHLYRPLYLLLAVLLFIISTIQFSERIEVLLHGERTNGKIISIT